jgi:hypothetical protein
MKCRANIRAATGEAFSDAEIDDIVDRMARRFVSRRKALPGRGDRAAMDEAAREMTREALAEALIARRLEAAAAKAKAARFKALDGMAGVLDAGDRLRAYNVGSDKQGFGTGLSVDAAQRARTVELWGEVELGLRAEPGLFDRISNWWGGGDAEFERKVVREMARLNEGKVAPTGDAQAEYAARIFNAAIEKGRQYQNAAGAWIARLDGYVVRQQHDRLRVAGGFWSDMAALKASKGQWSAARNAAARKAFGEWRDFIRPKLDPRTFDGIDPEDLGDLTEAAALHAAGVLKRPDDLVERFLYQAWWNIVAGKADSLAGAADVGEFRPPAGKARAVSKSRVLHFNTPDDWFDYHQRFGRGSLYGAVTGDLERAAGNSVLMERWGPNPAAAFENTRAELAGQARASGDMAGAERLNQSQRAAEFGEITGENNVPDNLRLAIIFRSIRLDQALSKLGGVVLSAASDIPLAAHAHVRAGGSWLEGYGAALGGITRLQGRASKEAADLLDVGARSAAAQLTSRFTASDGPLGWMASVSRLFYKVNLFQMWADGLRRGMAGMLSAHLGRNAARAFGAIDAGLRETLERFAIDAADWDRIRAGAVRADDGRTYLTFEAVEGLGDPDLELRFRAMVGEQLDNALTEARARERVGLHRGSKPGTPLGEAARSFTQFWSFNQAVMGRHVVPAARGHSGRTPAALLAHLILATTLMGYASMQAKQIVKGREPRSVLNADGELDFGEARKVMVASLLQGGGLGIYGDFLFGEANRGGNSFWATLGGPAVGELEKLAQITKAGLSGDTDDLPADLIRLGVSNTPFVNLWYSRLALDATVLWRLQEALSPGYLQRYEDRVRERENADFLIAPTDIVQ